MALLHQHWKRKHSGAVRPRPSSSDMDSSDNSEDYRAQKRFLSEKMATDLRALNIGQESEPSQANTVTLNPFSSPATKQHLQICRDPNSPLYGTPTSLASSVVTTPLHTPSSAGSQYSKPGSASQLSASTAPRAIPTGALPSSPTSPFSSPNQSPPGTSFTMPPPREVPAPPPASVGRDRTVSDTPPPDLSATTALLPLIFRKDQRAGSGTSEDGGYDGDSEHMHDTAPHGIPPFKLHIDPAVARKVNLSPARPALQSQLQHAASSPNMSIRVLPAPRPSNDQSRALIPYVDPGTVISRARSASATELGTDTRDNGDSTHKGKGHTGAGLDNDAMDASLHATGNETSSQPTLLGRALFERVRRERAGSASSTGSAQMTDGDRHSPGMRMLGETATPSNSTSNLPFLAQSLSQAVEAAAAGVHSHAVDGASSNHLAPPERQIITPPHPLRRSARLRAHSDRMSDA